MYFKLMNKSQGNLFFHPLFLSSLALLLLNDLFFKYQFHNWLTGKLSDFAGLLVFSIFFITIFPSRKKLVLILIALLFCWWKSSLSTPLIYFLNTKSGIPINRVIDYTDLFALFILPLALYLKPVKYKETVLRKCIAYIIAFISVTAFTATSLPRKLADNNKVQLDKYIRTKKDKTTIIKRLEEQGLFPVNDTIYERIWDHSYYLKSKDTIGTMIPVDSLYSGVYKKINYGFSYTIPKMYVDGDSISNLQFVISDYNLNGKKEIWLHSFEYKPAKMDSTYPTHSAYYAWKKFKKPIKKKFKEILRK